MDSDKFQKAANYEAVKRSAARGAGLLRRLFVDSGNPGSSAAPPGPGVTIAGAPADRLLPLLRDVSLLAAVFAYLAGWQFIRSYYKQLEIDPDVMDIAVNSYFVYAFFAVFNTWGGLLVSAFIAFILIWKRLRVRMTVQVLTLALFAWLLFLLASHEGTVLGRDLRKQFQTLAPVRFIFKDPNFEARVRADGTWKGTWFLVKATKDKFLVLAQEEPDPAFPGRLPAATTILIPAAEVTAGVELKDVQ